MGRGSVSNINLNQRIRQFVYLIVITVLGMIVSAAFLGKPVHKNSAPTVVKSSM